MSESRTHFSSLRLPAEQGVRVTLSADDTSFQGARCDVAHAAALLTQAMEKGPGCRGEPPASAQYRSHFFCWRSRTCRVIHPRPTRAASSRSAGDARLLPLAGSSLPFPGAVSLPKRLAGLTGNGLRICCGRLRKQLVSHRNSLSLTRFNKNLHLPPCPGPATAAAVSGT